MRNIPTNEDDSESITITSQQEASEMTRLRLARRRFLRRSTLAVGSLSMVASGAGALAMLYPDLTGQFGSKLDVGSKALFPAATPDLFRLNRAGVFYQRSARAFLIHLDKATNYLLTGKVFEDQLTEEWFTRDSDGSYWLALSQRCPHLGTPVLFRNDCLSFKCPSHGAHFHCDGEYLDGPAPKDMDRFPLSFNQEQVCIDTSRVIHVPRTSNLSSALRLLAPPQVPCMY